MIASGPMPYLAIERLGCRSANPCSLPHDKAVKQCCVPRGSASLFGCDLPSGFDYRNDFIDKAQEQLLLSELDRLEFSSFELRGVVARRRVAFFGRAYDARHAAVAALPEFLEPLRARVASWARVAPEAFAMTLVNRYPAGAPIGWHRDAPQYEMVAGVSLLSSCRMVFRPYQRPAARATTATRRASHATVLEPRSAYLMAGVARNDYEHHIPPVADLRYSITFRTLR
jgi:alkylated DNA repair dioxygenase AlkB